MKSLDDIRFLFYSLFYTFKSRPFFLPDDLLYNSPQIYNLPTPGHYIASISEGRWMDMHTESSKPSRHAVDMLLISWW